VESLAATFGVDWPHLGAQLVSFSIVCALLYRFAYRPVLRMLDARRQQIAQGLANAEKINARLTAIEKERHEIIAAASAEAARIIADARAAAARVTAQEAKRAAATAEQIVGRARDAAAQEHVRMLADARREVGRLAVQAAAAVTGKILTAADRRRLVDETVRDIA
jgi:F-type H+-transporting ATPase subunit b